MKKVYKFQTDNSLENRLKMVSKLQKKNNNSILVVIEKDKNCYKYPQLSSNMFMVSKLSTRMTVELQLKKRLCQLINRDLQTQSLLLYANSKLLNNDENMNDIYEKYKDKQDGILYLVYSSIAPF